MANAASYFVDRHVEEGRGSNCAYREAAGHRRSLTYAELARDAGIAGQAFLNAGFVREDRIALLLLDQIEYPALLWGCLKAGVIPVLLNTLLSTRIYAQILDDSRARGLVVSAELWPVIAPLLPDHPHLQKVVVVGAMPAGAADLAVPYDHFLAGAEPLATLHTRDDEIAFWLYSSGSTGAPKGVRHVHAALRATADTFGQQVLAIRQDDVVFSAAKIFFAYGLGNAVTFPQSVGATTILFNGRPTPDTVTEVIARERPTIFCGVPTLFAAILAHFDTQGAPDHRLRLSTSAGEALPAEIGQAWDRRIGSQILDGVGSTEMLHIFLSNRPGDIVYGTSGTAVPGYDLRCVNEAGDEITEGEVGELLVRGASAADGYWNQRDKSRATFEGEWTRTGDKYERRGDGRFVYCGRTDDMFKVSGIWVSPFEVEQAIIEHDAVLEAAVVAKEDADRMLKPKAFVVLKDAARAVEVQEVIRDFVKDRIGKWKYPRWVEIVDDLPKTATGKIQRFRLREDA
ncbi:MAG: benzoate-CoA ligase family protein [Pseudomonadota bacterium]